jgi:2-isopropylmalate synthase
MGFQFNRNDIDALYEAFLKVADIKKEVKEEDLSGLAKQYQSAIATSVA